MQKNSRKRNIHNLTKAPHRLAVHRDSISHLAPILHLEPSESVSITNSTRGTHFIFGSVASAAAVTALQLAQIKTQTQIALQQLVTLATITVGNQCHNNDGFASPLPPHLALLSHNRPQWASALGFNSNRRNAHLCDSVAMYHHSQQQASQPFSDGSRPPHHQPPPNQHQSRPASDMMVMGFPFPRPTQLPDELESALAIRGTRDMDHRLIDHVSRSNQHQNRSSGSGIGQHGNYGSNPVALTSDNQPAYLQGVDWSTYQPPTKLFASPPPGPSHQPQRHQGPQPQGSHTETSIPSWTTPVSDSPSPQARHPHGVGGDGQSLYTPESAGSILASFGLSNEDLEVLSHYPDDQLTPDTLPFILRDIQINKSGNQKPVTTSSASMFANTIHDMPLSSSHSSPLARSCSPEMPSLLTVTQTTGKVIDYGHASRAKDESNTRETFKREQLSSERTVKMYASSSSSSSAPKVDKVERRQVRLEQPESSKHGDQDYRRTSSDHRKNNRSPGREFLPSSKSRNLDRDYRHEGPKAIPSPESRSEASSRRSLSSSSGSKQHSSSSKKLPTPTMISDFSAVSPKVYPHTCSLCHIECDREKDWVDHINTVNHTAACRDLRNKYPDWKPHLPRSGRHGGRALWDPKDHSPSHSVSRSLSCSLSPSPPHIRHRVDPHPHRPHRRPYSLHHHPRYQPYTGPSSRSRVERPYDDSVMVSSESGQHPSSSKGDPSSKHGLVQSTKAGKSVMRPGSKTAKLTSKPPPAKKKKKLASQDSYFVDRLVYLTGIPNDASEQEVTDLVRSFGKINNVILMPCSEEESEKGEGQKASVCMVKAEHARALANSTNLSIRDHHITASVAKVQSGKQKSEADPNNSKPASVQDKVSAGKEPAAGGETDQKMLDEQSIVLITGLPESGWSETDIIKLVQPFGTPSDIILATQIGKALVSVPDMEIAQEMVKVNTFSPMKVKDSELKMIHLKQCISLSTPVALYNLLMGSVNPLESSVPVGWSSLLVISNVPNMLSGSSEVQKLVRRFGTVINTLVLKSMAIFEMATAAMALSVYKRFNTFPCIIQNNPLFFSRKPDPKANTQSKIISAYLDSSEVTPANSRGSKLTAAAEETARKSLSESPFQKESGANHEEMKTVAEDETVGGNGTKDDEDQKHRLADLICDSSAAPDGKPEMASEADMRETPAAGNGMETVQESPCAFQSGNDQTAAGEGVKPSSSDGKSASPDTAMPELPKVTQEMVKALLVECRTRTANQPSSIAASNDGEQSEKQTETDQAKNTAEETKESAKNQTEEEVKKQERERKDREARKEKEVRERDRRAWEKERAKKERERDEKSRREREKRDWERRERVRRERKRAYNEGSSRGRSFRGHGQNAWRDRRCNNSEAEDRTVEEEEEEFPFNMSDFVTLDEVGDVTDLPIETTEQDSRISVQQEAPGDKPVNVVTENAKREVKLIKTDEHLSETEPMTVQTAEGKTQSLVSSDLTNVLIVTAAESLVAASQAASSPVQTPVLTCLPEEPETETRLTATQKATTEVEPFPTPVPGVGNSSSNSPATGVVTTESEEEEKVVSVPNLSQPKEGKVVVEVSDTTGDQEKVQDEEDRTTGAPDATKHGQSEDRTSTEEESVKLELQMIPSMSRDTLPPFEPTNPVGIEFLVPKTGFFCKACNRFFSGSKEAEISHCKTLKHYENLQKYLQTKTAATVTTKPDSS